MYNNGQQQQMYAGARGYGGMPGQFQPGYNPQGFNNTGYSQQQGASNMAAYPQQQQQFQAGGYPQQHPGYPQQQQQQWYPNGQGYDQSNWSQQQQQHMGWNNGMGQWNGQQQPGNWANNMSPRTETTTPNMYNNSTQQQIPAAAGAKDSKRGSHAGAAASNKNVEMQPEAYQRTLEYVQQCQSWSNGAPGGVMSPDSSGQQPSNNGAKPKTRSPPAQAAGAPSDQASVMPPPMVTRPAPEAAGNMIIGDMSSSMNILTEENRFLHMMQ